MNTKSNSLFRTAGVLTATSLVLTTAQLSAADKTDAFPTFDSYIKVSGQAASIKGDPAAFQSRARTTDQLGAGIEDAHYSKDITKDTALTIDGRSLSGTEDYLLNFKLVKTEVGSVDVGYKQFRTFYDGVGGFFPGTNKFTSINQRYPNIPEGLFVDRGSFWAEVKLARPDAAELKLRYTNDTRNGQKDSTIWGDSDNTGQNFGVLNGGLTTVGSPVSTSTGVNSNASVRKNEPSYLDINERHQALEGSVKQTIGNTAAELTLTGDKSTKDNGRFVSRFPGERRPATQAPVNTSDLRWDTFNNQIDQATLDLQDTTTMGVRGTAITEFNPKLDLRTGAAYQNVSSDFAGSRTLLTAVKSPSTAFATTYDFLDLKGKSDVDVYTGTAAFDYKPISTLTASIGVRAEDQDAVSNGTYATSTTPGAARNREGSDTEEKSLTPVVDLRYSGIRNLALYSTVSHKAGTGTERTTNGYNTGTVTLPASFHNDIDESNTDYTVGANWRATSGLTLRAEPFYKDHRFQAQGYNTIAGLADNNTNNTLGNNYELDTQFWGAKLTAIVKATETLTFTNRYIYQRGDGQVSGFQPTYPSYDSMASTTHTIGETIDWTPIQQFYMQADANIVYNVIETASLHDLSVTNQALVVNSTTGAAAPSATAGTTSIQIPANRFIQNSNNNYITLSLLAGFVVTKQDDVQIQFSSYRTTNNDSGLATYTQPYGSSGTESTITLGLKHKVSARCIASGKVGYFDSHNDMTGGQTDFHGPLAYVSLEYGL